MSANFIKLLSVSSLFMLPAMSFAQTDYPIRGLASAERVERFLGYQSDHRYDNHRYDSHRRYEHRDYKEVSRRHAPANHRTRHDDRDAHDAHEVIQYEHSSVRDVYMKLQYYDEKLSRFRRWGLKDTSGIIRNVKCERNHYIVSQQERVKCAIKETEAALKALCKTMPHHSMPVVRMKQKLERQKALSQRMCALVRQQKVDDLWFQISSHEKSRNVRMALSLIESLLKLDPHHSDALACKRRLSATCETGHPHARHGTDYRYGRKGHKDLKDHGSKYGHYSNREVATCPTTPRYGWSHKTYESRRYGRNR